MAQQQILSTQVIGGAGGSSSSTLTVANAFGLETIPKGSPVYWSSADASGHPSVDKLLNSQSYPLLGVLTADLLIGSVATCQTAGVVTGLDTSGFSVGAHVYTSSTGTLTITPSGLFQHHVGQVLVSDVTNGSIFLTREQDGGDIRIVHSHQSLSEGGELSFAVVDDTFQWAEGSDPGAPPSGSQYVWIDVADHKLKRTDSDGNITIIG